LASIPAKQVIQNPGDQKEKDTQYTKINVCEKEKQEVNRTE
jgi:hypothetical protein